MNVDSCLALPVPSKGTTSGNPPEGTKPGFDPLSRVRPLAGNGRAWASGEREGTIPGPVACIWRLGGSEFRRSARLTATGFSLTLFTGSLTLFDCGRTMSDRGFASFFDGRYHLAQAIDKMSHLR
jgi:hypothetical protein